MFFKIGVLKNFTNFTRINLRWRLFLVKLQSWFAGILWKIDSKAGIFLWKFLRTSFILFQWLLLCLSGRLMFCKLNWYVETLAQVFFWKFLQNFQKHYWPPIVAASFSHKMQNIKIHYMQLHAVSLLFDGNYSQWGNRFHLSQRRIRT